MADIYVLLSVDSCYCALIRTGGGNIRERALTEEHARDSFENLLFSVCRFRELTGTYPQNITVSSYVCVHQKGYEVQEA